MKKTLLFCLVILLQNLLTAQTPTLVKDIKTATLLPIPNTQTGRLFGTLGNDVLYVTDDPEYGPSLFKSDGTINGTRMIKRVSNPNSYFLWKLNGKAYFWSNGNGITPAVLWETDGTYNGTKTVLNVSQLQPTFTDPELNRQLGNELWFGIFNRQSIWRTNGTLGGSVLVKDFANFGGISRRVEGMYPANNGTMYIVTATYNVVTPGFEIWKSDGTPNGTVLLGPLYADATNLDNTGFYSFSGQTVGNRLYILSNKDNPSTGSQATYLFTSDGTSAGTVPVRSFPFSSSNFPMVVAGNRVIFGLFSTGEIWSAEGLTTTNLIPSNFPFGSFSLQTINATTALVLASDPYGVASNKIFKTDGTLAGTSMLKTLPSGNYATFIGVTNGKALFFNRDGLVAFSGSYWRSDGTVAGTVSLGVNGTPNPLLYDGVRSEVDASGRIVFQNQMQPLGIEDLVQSDANLTTLTSIAGDRAGYARNANPSVPISFSGKAYFNADNGSGVSGWKSDGTAAGTVLQTSLAPSAPEKADIWQNNLYYTSGGFLYQQTPTSNPVQLSTFGSDIDEVEAVGNRLYWAKSSAKSIFYTTSPTAPATQITVVPAGWQLQKIHGMTEANGFLYFFTKETLNQSLSVYYRTGIYRFDGTNVLPINYYLGGGGFQPEFISNGEISAKGTEIFFADYTHLYKTGNGSDLVTTVFENTTTSYKNFKNLHLVGNTLVFNSTNAANGYELWKSDGTTAGTTLLKDLNPGVEDACPSEVTDFNGIGYFFVDNCHNEYAFWKTDGTTTGTVKVNDLPEFFKITTPLVAVGYSLYFGGDSYPSGNELWKITPTSNACSPDVTPPTIAACPANISVSTTLPQGLPQQWAAPTAIDNCTAATLTSTFQSGATFPIGTTTVVYTARDAANNSATCAFTITVSLSGGNNGVDLEITALTTNPTPGQWGSTQVKFTVKNNGTQTATSAKIKTSVCVNGTLETFGQATGIVYSGTPGAPTLGSFNFVNQEWTLTNLAAGQSSTLTLPLFLVTANALKIAAIVTEQSPGDVDSQPNATLPNCTPTQDDEAVQNLNGGGTNPCLNDLTPPTISGCPTNITQQVGAAPAVITWTAPTATDNCGTPSLPPPINQVQPSHWERRR
jgi:ELWxxDGT repeat protein